MKNHKLVLPENLNQYGFLFGGYLLKWVDEYAWISASLDYPGCNFVTIGMDTVEFRKTVKKGTILKFITKKTKEGNTSVQYSVNVYRGNIRGGKKELVFFTHVTVVRIDEEGNKIPLLK
ncbi:MAG: acyl-CoA thioesterase [Kiritimatiellia bacterium]|nr:acyl-CoA thioesterase [Kiritimatiellia bacterium]